MSDPTDLPSAVDFAADESIVEDLDAETTETAGDNSEMFASRSNWSALDSVQVKNFKAINDADIPLGKVTILVGPNRSGKSSALQAIHWAARAATYIRKRYTKETISHDRIDYLPASDPLSVAHNGELKSRHNTTPVSVTFKHSAPFGGNPAAVTISIWAANNRSGISAQITGGEAVSSFKQRDHFITAYIPGLAGLSENETILAQPQLRRRAASGNAGSVLRNILYNLQLARVGEAEDAGTSRLLRLNQLISEVHPDTEISVSFDDREDVDISATIKDSADASSERALESAATGILQVVQIFAYLILFRPKIMLVDEPDAHLHPDKQERLIEALERAADEFDTQVILTTHSPNIVRAACPDTKIVWMQQGMVNTDQDKAVRDLLGWGGLDKRVLFFIEDEDDQAIRSILKQWPYLSQKIAVCRTFGVSNMPRRSLLEGLLGDGGLALKALIHRDADFMTPADIVRWKDLYHHANIRCWVTTAGSDVESYFCQPSYLSALYGVSLEIAQKWASDAAANVSGAHKTFLDKRRQIIHDLYEYGGGELAENLWLAAPNSPTTVIGKSMLSKMKKIVKDSGYDDKLLNRYQMVSGYEMAPDLRALLEEIIAL